MTDFIVILTYWWWSRTDPAISPRYVGVVNSPNQQNYSDKQIKSVFIIFGFCICVVLKIFVTLKSVVTTLL